MSGTLDDSIEHRKALRRELRSIKNKIENRERQIKLLAEGLPQLMAKRAQIEAGLNDGE